MPHTLRRFVYLAAWLIALTQNTLASEFIPLGTLPGSDFSWARGVFDDGSVVVGRIDGEGFRWTDATGMVGLGRLPGTDWCQAGFGHGPDGISGDGTVVVGTCTSGDGKNLIPEAYIYTEAEGMRGLGRNSIGMDASFDGSVVVGYSRGEHGEAFRWTEEEGLVGLGILLDHSIALDVSADGSVIVGYNQKIGGETEVFRWTKETGMEAIGVRDTEDTASVSADGKTIAGSATITTDREAYRWTESTGAIGLGWLPDTANADGTNNSRARDINGDGSTVIGLSGFGDDGNGSDNRKGFIWTEKYGMEDLQQVLIDRYDLGPSLDGWTLYAPQDISPNGRFITGIGLNPDGGYEGWLVRLDTALMPYSDVRGDFDLDGELTVNDINVLSKAIQAHSSDAFFDLNESGSAGVEDLALLIHDEFNTYFGDANLDGEFNSSDLVAVFEAGHYEDAIAGNSGWSNGDWNGDAEFSTSDLVHAFQDGGYEQGPRAAAHVVPEPTSGVTFLATFVPMLLTARLRGR